MKELKSLTHYIADQVNQKTGIAIYEELPESEYKTLTDMLFILYVFRDCYSIKEMLLESKNDIAHFFYTLSNEVIPPDDSIVAPYLITANKLLMNYLSFLKTFFDVISNNITKMHEEQLPSFQKYDKSLYDDLFGYRFLKRLRNYAIHREMPLKHIESSSQNGTRITCEKTSLLKFDGWSAVKKEISVLDDCIDVLPYIEESKEAILKLYVKALEILEYDVYSLKMHIERLYFGIKTEYPIIIRTGETMHKLSVEKLPMYYLDLFYSEQKLYSMYRE